jgi:hypothetical protein
MDYREELLQAARRSIADHPEQRCEIIDLYTLAVGEIEEGGKCCP